MKVKLINKENPITKMWCFKFTGYDSNLIESINSGKEVEVQKVPKPAWGYVEEVKAKPIKAKKQNKGKSPKGE
tara:strand:+ start:333 stop:551 length:219 start_codon:yes stop_codon:yes gene_type:complete